MEKSLQMRQEVIIYSSLIVQLKEKSYYYIEKISQYTL